MEILVVVAIILVLAAIAVPAYTAYVSNANKGVALRMLKDLASSAQTFISDNNGDLPLEDATGTDSWAAAADPANAKAWYNALPKIMGRRTVADYAVTPRAFYTKENVLYLPGATYPESDRKLVKPLFAIGINNKLQRKDADGRNRPSNWPRSLTPPALPCFSNRVSPARKSLLPCRATETSMAPPKPAPSPSQDATAAKA
jgi:Tfp pilus assembly protein PilE